jgi:hypothetical protein
VTAITSSGQATTASSAGSSKRGSDAVVRSSNAASKDELDGRPKKLQKQSTSSSVANKGPSLFTQDEDDVDSKPGTSATKSLQAATAAAGTSRIGAPRAMGGSRTSAMVITGSGKVIRKGPAPALQPKPSSSAYTSTTNHTSSVKGKERAVGINEGASTSRSAPASVSAFTSSVGPPRLPLNIPASYFPVATRNAMIKNIYHEFIRLYEHFAPKQRHDLATEHALSQEATIYGKNNKVRLTTL